MALDLVILLEKLNLPTVSCIGKTVTVIVFCRTGITPPPSYNCFLLSILRCIFNCSLKNLLPPLSLVLVNQLSHLSFVLGHRMGGKTLMTLALTQPERFKQVAIVDIAPSAEVLIENTTNDLEKLANLQLYKFQCKEDLEAYLREQQLVREFQFICMFELCAKKSLGLSIFPKKASEKSPNR